jgi:hypothetical protein
VLALAAWLRFDGLGFGLDLRDPENAQFTSDVDARGMELEVQQLFERGDLDPGSFLFRGPAGFLLFAAVDAVLIGAQAPFHPGGWRGVVADLHANPSLLHLSHRALAALAGVLTVLLLFRIARRELGERAALAGALILAVAYLHVRHSHFGTVDVLSGLATLRRSTRCCSSCGSRGRGGTSGADPRGRGDSDSTSAASSACAGALDGARTEEELEALAWLALGMLACPLGFFVAAPTVLLAPGNLVHHVLYDVDELKPGGESASLWSNLAAHGELTLAIGLGETALLLALAGYWPLWRRGRAGRFLVLASLLLTSALVATRVQNLRYGIPFLVTLAIPAGLVLAQLAARLRWPAAAALTVVVIAPSLARSFAFDQLVKRLDTRIEMLAALRARGRRRRTCSPRAPRPAGARAHGGAAVPLRPQGGAGDLQARPRASSSAWRAPRGSLEGRTLATRYREVLRLGWASRRRVEAPAHRLPESWLQTRPGPALVL